MTDPLQLHADITTLLLDANSYLVNAQMAVGDFALNGDQASLTRVLECRASVAALLDQIPALVGPHLQPEEKK